jgi:hypothetical protein
MVLTAMLSQSFALRGAASEAVGLLGSSNSKDFSSSSVSVPSLLELDILLDVLLSLTLCSTLALNLTYMHTFTREHSVSPSPVSLASCFSPLEYCYYIVSLRQQLMSS